MTERIFNLNPLHKRNSYIIIKALLFMGVFSLVHFIHDFIPIPIILIIGANDESVFSHMKMAFWSWLILSLFEYIFLRKLIKRKNFIISRAIITISIPYLEILVYYIVVFAAREELPLALELTWAFSTVFIIGAMGRILENDLEEIEFKMKATVLIIILLGLSLFFFTVFTYAKPWLDIFYIPE